MHRGKAGIGDIKPLGEKNVKANNERRDSHSPRLLASWLSVRLKANAPENSDSPGNW